MTFQETAAPPSLPWFTSIVQAATKRIPSPFCEPRNDGREIVVPPNSLLLSRQDTCAYTDHAQRMYERWRQQDATPIVQRGKATSYFSEVPQSSESSHIPLTDFQGSITPTITVEASRGRQTSNCDKHPMTASTGATTPTSRSGSAWNEVQQEGQDRVASRDRHKAFDLRILESTRCSGEIQAPSGACHRNCWA